MFKKSSRVKNIRRKIETSDDENNNEETVVATTIDKKKQREPKKVQGLSFDQEEEGDVETFTVKKSNASRRLASGRKLKLPESTLNVIETTETETQPSSGYSSELLESLRKSTPRMPASLNEQTMDPDDALLAEKFPLSMGAQEDASSIPSAHAILAAKKKREQLRKGAVELDSGQDFISLNSVNENSRLVREEDDVGDDGEAEYEKYVGERLTLNKSAARKQEMERRENARELIDEAQNDEDAGSEDFERWENDLIRHGGVKPQRKEEEERDPYAPPPGYRPAIIPEQTPISLLSEVISNLDSACNNLVQMMKQHESHLQQTEDALKNLEIVEGDIEKEIARGSRRYDYFQELTNYVNDLGELLDAKFPELDNLEQKAHDIFEKQFNTVTQRRWLDDMDDLHTFAIIPPSASQNQGFGKGVVADGQAWSGDDAARQKRKTERQQRLKNRQELMGLAEQEALQEQGFWSDDEMTEDWMQQREQELEDIEKQDMNGLVGDISDEFRTIDAVKRNFEAWKTEFYDDYTKAYGSLSLPGAFEFYVRCELVAWDPFSEPIDFDTMHWHRVLSQYGITDDENGHEDADTELLNKLVEKTMIKKLKSMLDVLNIASMREMRYAAQAVEQVSYYVEKDTRPFQDLVGAVEATIEHQLQRKVELMDTIKLRRDTIDLEAKERFFWRQCKYLKTLYVWRRYLSKEVMKSLANIVMNSIIAPILEPSTNPLDAKLQQEALALVSKLQ